MLHWSLPRLSHESLSNSNRNRLIAVAAVLVLLSGCTGGSASAPAATASAPTAVTAATTAPAATAEAAAGTSLATGGTITLYGAGTLAGPFNNIDKAFQQANPNLTVQAQFGGSVAMAKKIKTLNQPADILAVADYNVIPQQLYSHNGSKAYADWYTGFVANAITFVYTDKSKGASQINADNWYQVMAQPGVEIGRSNPDTDPSGYQTLQMLQLAEDYYHQPGLAQAILKNAPSTNMRDTETELIAALQSGQIDYLAVYRSDAIQHHFNYLQLPPQINLSDASMAADYAKVTVHTANGNLPGKPIIYAVTIPSNAPHPELAQTWVSFLLGAQGQAAMQQAGFVVINPPIASGDAQVPTGLQQLVKPWPGA